MSSPASGSGYSCTPTPSPACGTSGRTRRSPRPPPSGGRPVAKDKERQAFLKALKKNEDDVTTRMVYADWLDDRGEHEEADRQRKWPAAKEWLVRFARQFNAAEDDPNAPPLSYQELSRINWFPVTYRNLLELGRQGMAEGYIDCGANEDLCEALRLDAKGFWRN